MQFVSLAMGQVQTPSEQMSPAAQTTLQSPQLFTSLATLVHTAAPLASVQQSLLPAAQTTSPCNRTCAATAGNPTVIDCALLGFPGGK